MLSGLKFIKATDSKTLNTEKKNLKVVQETWN